MYSKRFVLICVGTLMMVLQTSHADDRITISCKPFSKKGSFIKSLVTKGTITCPPPDLLGNDDEMFCCAQKDTGIPYCCDAAAYADQVGVGVILIAVLVVLIVILLVSCVCCLCCPCCLWHKRRNRGTVYY